jgi:hypothetical protein
MDILRAKIKEDKDCFCGAYYNRHNCPVLHDYLLVNSKLECEKECRLWLHKWPTPEQYKKEYGTEIDRNFPVWFKKPGYDDWVLGRDQFRHAGVEENDPDLTIVCACTSWSKPSKDWRPEEAQ